MSILSDISANTDDLHYERTSLIDVLKSILQVPRAFALSFCVIAIFSTHAYVSDFNTFLNLVFPPDRAWGSLWLTFPIWLVISAIILTIEDIDPEWHLAAATPVSLYTIGLGVWSLSQNGQPVGAGAGLAFSYMFGLTLIGISAVLSWHDKNRMETLLKDANDALDAVHSRLDEIDGGATPT